MNLLFLDFLLGFHCWQNIAVDGNQLIMRHKNEKMWWHFITGSDRNWAAQIIIFAMIMITQILAARIWYLEYAKTMLIICIIHYALWYVLQLQRKICSFQIIMQNYKKEESWRRTYLIVDAWYILQEKKPVREILFMGIHSTDTTQLGFNC